MIPLCNVWLLLFCILSLIPVAVAAQCHAMFQPDVKHRLPRLPNGMRCEPLRFSTSIRCEAMMATWTQPQDGTPGDVSIKLSALTSDVEALSAAHEQSSKRMSSMLAANARVCAKLKEEAEAIKLHVQFPHADPLHSPLAVQAEMAAADSAAQPHLPRTDQIEHLLTEQRRSNLRIEEGEVGMAKLKAELEKLKAQFQMRPLSPLSLHESPTKAMPTKSLPTNPFAHAYLSTSDAESPTLELQAAVARLASEMETVQASVSQSAHRAEQLDSLQRALEALQARTSRLQVLAMLSNGTRRPLGGS